MVRAIATPNGPISGTSRLVTADDAHYKTPGGVYAPFGHDARHLIGSQQARGRLTAKWFEIPDAKNLGLINRPDRIHYLAGESLNPSPPATVVLIGGLGANVMIDEKSLAYPLLAKHNVIAVDLPGCGLSGWLTNADGKALTPDEYERLPVHIDGVPKSLALSIELARATIALIDHQVGQWPDAPVILCGHSMGALAGVLMLTNHDLFPETVHNIGGGVLLNAFASDAQEMPAHWYLNFLAKWVANTHEITGFPLAASILTEWVGVFSVLAFFSKDRSLKALIEKTQRSMFTHMPRPGLDATFLRDRVYAQTILARMIAGSLSDLDTLIIMKEVQERISIPVSVMLGTDDPLTPTERVRSAFQSSIPSVTVHTAERAGHMHPQDNAEDVLNFIESSVRAMIGLSPRTFRCAGLRN